MTADQTDRAAPGRLERHPRHQLDPLVHFPIRLSIMAYLAAVAEAEFAAVAEAIEITAPTLSKQVTLLEEAGYLTVRKGYVGKRPRTWLALSPTGRTALAGHLDTLRAIANPAAQSPDLT